MFVPTKESSGGRGGVGVADLRPVSGPARSGIRTDGKEVIVPGLSGLGLSAPPS